MLTSKCMWLQRISKAYSSVYLCLIYLFPPVHRWVHIIYYQLLYHSMHSSLLLINYCHRQMRVVWTVLKHRNRQYSFIHKHHYQFSWVFPGYPFSLFRCLIQFQWSLQTIHIHIFPTLLFLRPSPFQVNIVFIICICQFLPYSWGGINDFIMKTQSDMWRSFSITIWWTSYINITCCLSFSSWICLTYSCIFYIVIFHNIILIWISKLIFWILHRSNLLFG